VIIGDGGGGGVTSWNGYDIEAMHRMVRAVDDGQIRASWDQVAAWRKAHELLDTHAGRLDTYRQGLIEKWPPESNAAAVAFVKYVDDLITSLRQASDAADSNYRALAGLTGEVMAARKAVTEAYREYQANKGKLDAHQQEVDAYKADTTAMPLPSPGPSPVAPQRQQELTNKARTAMSALSDVALASSSQMRVPPPYRPPTTPAVQNREHIDEPPSVVMPPPMIPPPRTSRSTQRPSAPRGPLPTGTANAPVPGPSDGGPVLTGRVIAPPTPGPAPLPPPVSLPVPPGGGPLPPVGLIGGPLPGPPGANPADAGGARRGGVPAVTERGGLAPRALPPNGVIGSPSPAHPPAGAGRAPQANPVGGVIGQSAPATGQAGSAAGQRPGTGGTSANHPFVAGRRSRSEREREQQGWDPDNPWAVDQGVAPVLEPGREPSSHDPGTGVIGIDR
jgi:hypothetical protein